jgi:protein SCO1/2
MRLSRQLRATSALIVALAMAIGSAASCGRAVDAAHPGAPDPTERPLTGLQRQSPPDVSSVTFADARTGQPFTSTPAAGELSLVYFGYTSCPDVCPTTLSDLRRALRQLGDDASRVELTFVTVDPGRDTATVLDGYVGSFVTRYHTVRIDDPAALARAEEPFGARSSTGPPRADGTYDVTHTAGMYVVDDTGHIVLEWPFGTPSDAAATDLEILLARSPAPPNQGTSP